MIVERWRFEEACRRLAARALACWLRRYPAEVVSDVERRALFERAFLPRAVVGLMFRAQIAWKL